MKTLFGAGLVSFLMVSSVYAQSTLALQEKCSSSAKGLFVSIHPNRTENTDYLGQCLWNYECHYNKKMDKCFILLTGTCAQKNEFSNQFDLVDVFEEKIYASYVCRYDKSGALEWRHCLLGQTQFNMLNGREFNKETRKWNIISEAYTNSLKNHFSDSMKETFDKWIKPFMEE